LVTEGFRLRILDLGKTLTGLALLMATGSALAECRDEWICVDAVNEGGNIEFHARNLGDFPITYTLKISGPRQLHIDGPDTVTRTLAPKQAQQAMQLKSAGAIGNSGYRIDYEWTVGDKDAIHDDDHVYSLPYASGTLYRVLQGYGSRFSHTGLEEFAIDFDMPVGTPVHAARDGVVARVVDGNSEGCWEDGCGRYANFVVILHSDGTTGEYYHLMQDGSLVSAGERVWQGQRIAYSGNTGHTTMPHLHFAVYRATDWGNTQSIPVRFQGTDGIIVKPRRGGRYQAL
jgi:murein DD-endopeptidase MepM/ murein hydrolase activator NlpD